MKKIVVLGFAVFCSTFGYSQEENDPFLKLTLPQAKKQLLEVIANINDVKKLSGMQIRIQAIKKSTKPVFEDKPSTPLAPEKIKAFISQSIESRVEQYKIILPNRRLELKSDYENEDVLNAISRKINVLVSKIYFKDGSSQKLADTLDYGKIVEFSPKPADSILLNINYKTYQKLQSYKVSKLSKSVKVDDSEIIMDALKGTEVAFHYPSNLKDNIVGIFAYYKNGKCLKQQNYSSNTAPSQFELDKEKKYATFLKETIVKLDDKQFTNTKQLYDYILEKDPTKDLENPNKNEVSITNSIYGFGGEIDNLVFYVKEKEVEINQQLTLKSADPESDFGVWEVVDNDTKKSGLVDKKGNVLIDPKYEDLRPVCKNLFAFSEQDKVQKDTSYTTYSTKFLLLSSNKKSFKPLEKFEIFQEEISENYAIVEKAINESYGIIDTNTWEFVLPMEYVFLRFKNNLLTARKAKFTYGGSEPEYDCGFTIGGKIILPCKYNSVETDGTYFYTNFGKEQEIKHGNNVISFDQNDVFDQTGKKLNPDNTMVFGQFYKNQPVVIKDKKLNYFLLDNSGKTTLIKVKFDEINPISNQMIVVKKGDLYGALDESGTLVIPFIYKDLNNFQEKYALAEKVVNGKDVYVFLDKKGVVVKTINSSFRSSNVGVNGNDARYRFENAAGKLVIYNEDGVISADKRYD